MKVESLLNATIEDLFIQWINKPWNEQSRMLKKRKKFIWLELVPLLLTTYNLYLTSLTALVAKQFLIMIVT